MPKFDEVLYTLPIIQRNPGEIYYVCSTLTYVLNRRHKPTCYYFAVTIIIIIILCLYLTKKKKKQFVIYTFRRRVFYLYIITMIL